VSIGDGGQGAVKIEPRNELEEIILGCFEGVSGASGIVIDDEIFAADGNKLGVMRIASELREGSLMAREVPVGVLYKLVTVRRVAEWIQVEKRGAWSDVVEMKKEGGRLEEADVVDARWVRLVEWVSEACGAIG
jgi:hypothetical protein